jgi:hypothetical protein
MQVPVTREDWIWDFGAPTSRLESRRQATSQDWARPWLAMSEHEIKMPASESNGAPGGATHFTLNGRTRAAAETRVEGRWNNP